MVVSNSAVRRRRPVRRRTAALLVASAVAAVSLGAVPTADAAGPRADDATPAASAVRALTDAAAAPAFPDDFGAVTGYRPAVVDGLLVAPQGSCSSPVPLPAEFDIACKAHDLGYDLLRYAQHNGHPLGGWARRDLDRALTDRMLSACRQRPESLARTRCLAMAAIAATAVDLNSRRQGYGVPVVEHFPLAETATVRLSRTVALVLAAFAALLTWQAYASGRFGRPQQLFDRLGSRGGTSSRQPSGPVFPAPLPASGGTRSRRPTDSPEPHTLPATAPLHAVISVIFRHSPIRVPLFQPEFT